MKHNEKSYTSMYIMYFKNHVVYVLCKKYNTYHAIYTSPKTVRSQTSLYLLLYDGL